MFFYLRCSDQHFLSQCLVYQGIDRNTPDPEGGAIDRDEMGEPTGILREKAYEHVRSFIQEDRNTLKQYIERALQYCVSVGLTSVQTNDESSWQCKYDQCCAIYSFLQTKMLELIIVF